MMLSRDDITEIIKAELRKQIETGQIIVDGAIDIAVIASAVYDKDAELEGRPRPEGAITEYDPFNFR